MSTMKLVLSNVSKISPAWRSNSNTVTVECDMETRDMEDAIAQICEQIGDEEFLKYVKAMVE